MEASFEKEYVPSNIQQYFAGKTVFLTGATGFLGKLVLEKLLRSCSDVKTIHVLLREKEQEKVEKRFEELLDSAIFSEVRGKIPNLSEKVNLIKGDISMENLGIGQKDAQKLCEEVNCVFHCASDVRFNNDIKSHAYANVRSTRDLLKMSKNMAQLEALIYVSTAYSNCLNDEVKEVIYNPPMTGHQLLTLLDTFDDEFIKNATPSLLENWPNACVYSKCVAESVLDGYRDGLPIAIIRPSIITSTYKEPLPGWVDNIYGSMKVDDGVNLGLVHVLNCEKDALIDVVPADYVVNCVVAAAWDTATQQSFDNYNKNDQIKVYNCVCSPQNPITYGQFSENACREYSEAPSQFSVWYPFILFCSSPLWYKLATLLLHVVPRYVINRLACCCCCGKWSEFLKIHEKISSYLKELIKVTNNGISFHNENTQALWNKLNNKDKRNFHFDISELDWRDYFFTFVRGSRMYVLNDSVDLSPKERKQTGVVKLVHYLLFGIIVIALYLTLHYVFSWLVSIFL